MDLKVITANVRGLGDHIKRRKLFRFFHESKYDIILLQETHSCKSKERIWKSEWGGAISFDHDKSNSRGVCILYSPKLDVRVIKSQRSTIGRYLISQVKINDQEFTIANIYGPNESSSDFFRDIFDKICQTEQTNQIIAGDFNVVLNPMIDKKSVLTTQKPTKMDPAAIDLVKQIDQNNWLDIWRVLNPETFRFTWKRSKPLIMSRLDYILIPQALASSVLDAQIISNPFSDHSFVEMMLVLSEQIRGRGLWKMNNTHLQDKIYIETVNRLIEEANKKYTVDPGTKWEPLKEDIIIFSQNYARRKASDKKKQKNELNKKLAQLNKKLSYVNLKSEFAIANIEKLNVKFDQCKVELEKLENESTRGAMLRSKARYYKLGETMSKYFFQLEKRSSKAKVMTQIYDDKAQLTSNPKNILNEQMKFYQKLYTSDQQVKFSISIPPESKVNAEQNVNLESTITTEELGKALSETQNDKTPGPCGLSVNFLKVFWGKLKILFTQLTNFVFKVKKVHTSARQGVITLIPKKNRDVRMLKNWRPIILLCVDYKLIAKTIANRLKKILNDIIHPDQCGFLKGRGCTQNIRKTLDTVNYTKENNIDGLMLLIDFEKAFDRVEYQSLYDAMQFLNFNSTIIRWMQILFTDFWLCTTNNGYQSKLFQPTRGLFQGNPISSYGFLLIIEILGILLRQNKNIIGLKMGSFNNLLSMFADDMSIFIVNKQAVWLEVRATLEYFRQTSGLKVNYDKSVVYRLGSARKTNAKFYSEEKLHWTNDPVNMLGVMISDDEDELVRINIEPLLEKIKEILTPWLARNLSLIGKVLVVNSLVASIFMHRLKVLPDIPTSYVDKYNKVVKDFIWEGGKEKIKWNILTGNKQDGGLGLFDITNKQKALKVQWIFDLPQNSPVKWLADYFLNNKLGDLLWEANLKGVENQRTIVTHNFWLEVLQHWSQLNYEHKDQGQNQIIWYNSEILIENKSIFYRKWSEAGINRVKDVIENNQWLTEQDIFRKHKLRIPFTRLKGLQQAIRNTWPNILSEDHEKNETVETNFQKLRKNKSNVKTLYIKFNAKQNLLEPIVQKWGRYEDFSINESEILEAINRLYKITGYTKLRSFQYHLLCHAITTNTQLFHYKIKPNNYVLFARRPRKPLSICFTIAHM